MTFIAPMDSKVTTLFLASLKSVELSSATRPHLVVRCRSVANRKSTSVCSRPSSIRRQFELVTNSPLVSAHSPLVWAQRCWDHARQLQLPVKAQSRPGPPRVSWDLLKWPPHNQCFAQKSTTDTASVKLYRYWAHQLHKRFGAQGFLSGATATSRPRHLLWTSCVSIEQPIQPRCCFHA